MRRGAAEPVVQLTAPRALASPRARPGEHFRGPSNQKRVSRSQSMRRYAPRRGSRRSRWGTSRRRGRSPLRVPNAPLLDDQRATAVAKLRRDRTQRRGLRVRGGFPIIRLLLAALVVATGRLSSAACTDPGAVASTRAAAESQCHCATATSHGEYVRCVAAVAKADASLPSDCRSAVIRCAARSTCGKPGFVTCCRTSSKGTTACARKSTAAKCVAHRGGSVCVGLYSSCCDACAATGCATTTTTTLPPCGGGPSSCSGACPPGLTCAMTQDMFPFCGCVPDGSQPCGGATFPYCNGQCPSGEACGAVVNAHGSTCFCHPAGTTACGDAQTPTCGGACPTSQQCGAFRTGTLTFCACVNSAQACECGPVPGVCPPGQFCVLGAGPPCGCVLATRCCAGNGACLDATAADATAKCALLGGTLADPGFMCDGTTGRCGPMKQAGPACCECAVSSPPFPHPQFCIEGPEPGPIDEICLASNGCTLTPGLACGPVTEKCGGSPSGAFLGRVYRDAVHLFGDDLQRGGMGFGRDSPRRRSAS